MLPEWSFVDCCHPRLPTVCVQSLQWCIDWILQAWARKVRNMSTWGLCQVAS